MSLIMSYDASELHKAIALSKSAIARAAMDASRAIGSVVSKELKAQYYSAAQPGNDTSTGLTKRSIGHKVARIGDKGSGNYTSIIGSRKNFVTVAKSGWGKQQVRKASKIWHLIQHGTTTPRIIKTGKFAGLNTGNMPNTYTIERVHQNIQITLPELSSRILGEKLDRELRKI